jgi:hypothetical protein
MEDFVDMQTTSFHALVHLGGCHPELVAWLDQGPGECAQRCLAVEASATRLAHIPVLLVGHRIREALHPSETRVVVVFLAAARQRHVGWLCVRRAVTTRNSVTVADLTGRANVTHPELGNCIALARRAVRALGVGRPQTERTRLTWVH